MKLYSWNVNGIRAVHRKGLFLSFLEKHQPDILCLQETKVKDDDFPLLDLRAAGYHVTYRGHSGYNGVATLSLKEPESVLHGLCEGPDAEDDRILMTVIDGIPIVNTYVPQGHKIATDRYVFKLDGSETIAVSGLAAGIKPRMEVTLDITRADGSAQSVPLLCRIVTNETSWQSIYETRPTNGAPVEIVWEQGIWGGDNWSILAGTPNADACREFIKFASDPKRQAALTEYFPAGLTQPEAFDLIKPEIAKNCPTYPDNIKKGLKIDAKFWFDNQASVIERFNGWVLK